MVELLHINLQRHFAEHLDKAAVTIVSETGHSRSSSPGLRWSCRSSPGSRWCSSCRGMENFAPDRTLTSSGSSTPPSFLPISASSFATASRICVSTSLGTLLPFSKNKLQTSVEIVNPGGTGTPALHISAKPAPLPPSTFFHRGRRRPPCLRRTSKRISSCQSFSPDFQSLKKFLRRLRLA